MPYKIRKRYNYTPNQSRLIHLGKAFKEASNRWMKMWIGLKIWWLLNKMRSEMDKSGHE